MSSIWRDFNFEICFKINEGFRQGMASGQWARVNSQSMSTFHVHASLSQIQLTGPFSVFLSTRQAFANLHIFLLDLWLLCLALPDYLILLAQPSCSPDNLNRWPAITTPPTAVRRRRLHRPPDHSQPSTPARLSAAAGVACRRNTI